MKQHLKARNVDGKGADPLDDTKAEDSDDEEFESTLHKKEMVVGVDADVGRLL